MSSSLTLYELFDGHDMTLLIVVFDFDTQKNFCVDFSNLGKPQWICLCLHCFTYSEIGAKGMRVYIYYIWWYIIYYLDTEYRANVSPVRCWSWNIIWWGRWDWWSSCSLKPCRIYRPSLHEGAGMFTALVTSWVLRCDGRRQSDFSISVLFLFRNIDLLPLIYLSSCPVLTVSVIFLMFDPTRNL